MTTLTTLKNYICKCLCLVAILSVTSCVVDSGTYPDDAVSQQGNWITLQFLVSEGAALTRANPASGEDGNGREEEIFNEAALHDVNIFLFADSLKDSKLLNTASNTSLTHLYFNLDDPGDGQNSLTFTKERSVDNDNMVVYTVTFLDEVPGIVLPLRKKGTVRFITIANMGKSMKDEISTLEDLRDYSSLSQTWDGSDQDVKDYDRFVMTTAYENSTDSYINFNNEDGAGTETNPFRGKTTLQRMCARIDLMYASSNWEGSGDGSVLTYPVKDTDNKVDITNILTVNVMSKPSCLFKKVTYTLPDEWTYISGYTWGGREEADDDGIPSNYVIEPTTLIKETLSSENLIENLRNWYGETRTSAVKLNIVDPEKGKTGGYRHEDLKTNDTGFESYSKVAVLGYANENTQSPNQFNSNFLTGITFRAVYFPEKIYSGYAMPAFGESSTGLKELTGELPAGAEIYRYSPSDGSVSEDKSLYFSNETSCRAYQDAHPAEYGVVTVFNAVSHDGKYGFVCYYNLWLLHYDDVNDIKSDPHFAYPMQYATVRNNIYRVALSFSGPGDPTPTMREPETMQARIYVRKWNQRKEKDALLF